MQSIEALRRRRYREYNRGKVLDFAGLSFNYEGALVPSPYSVTVGEVKQGGYFGKVIIPVSEGFVIKTPQPGPLQDLMRMPNWRFKEFPHSVDERAAQLEHLSTRLIHEVLPVLTHGKFRSPASYGYTYLGNGYAQLIEKMEGRVLRYDTEVDEYQEFKQAQTELTRLAYSLGLEQVGQIHPNNPFALSNLWKDPNTNTWVWVDVAPAMRHSMGRVFPFHKEIQKYFKSPVPTFNQVHTDMFRSVVEAHKDEFGKDRYWRVMRDLELYDVTFAGFEKKPTTRRDAVGVVVALSQLSRDIEEHTPWYKFVHNPTFRNSVLETAIAIIKDPEFRTHYLYRQSVMRGVERARQLDIITQDEYARLWQEVENDKYDPSQRKRKLTYAGLQTGYFAAGFIGDLVAGTIGLDAARDMMFEAIERGSVSTEDILQGGLALVLWKVIPALIRPQITRGISRLSEIDLRVAQHVSALPLPFITYFILPAQIAAGKTDEILHYQIRWFIAKMSAFLLLGGEGSEGEAYLWNKIGKRLEGRFKHSEN
ncbi:hypothetical protein A2690_02900 [Candidatus Roizmanbacteria bacterium RIFCSPHIGHO2_01_FULL_39_12b]|uniref:Uncharacterized protein n=1 Tax=Candidatus Roizmanbacteria bacterium RIFCSPHIGHO2_01_FULL_39_12b TaxID=1802030 RepID=A0A1F7G8H7_9BACT|nr:MAG: hypothetical protein A2690_02900 [Candidatus Roizmanbacteria bacterium RIFCSPHIGHO2_01_FULL_39_12b]OGK45930.1 MAG: hypothetical protein A3B46_02715 [Candidatus Roizmanbacteria bacterium RIFCSPLOWO2_01_FULL_39_19]